MAENQYMQPFFDTLSQGVQVAQHLHQAALQQQQLDLERQRQGDEANFRQQELDRQNRDAGLRENLDQANLIGKGAKSVDDQGNVATPTPAPQNTMNPSSASGMDVHPGLNYTLNGVANTQLPADQGRTVSVGGRSLEVPGVQEMLDQDVAKRKADATVGKVPLTKEGSGMIGGMFAEGTPIDPAHMPGLASVARANALNNKPARTTRLEQKGFTEKGEPITFDPDTGETTVGKPIPGMAGQGGAGKQLTPDAALGAREKAIKEYQDATKEEGELNSQRLRLGTALNSGVHYVSTNEKGGTKLTPFGSMDDKEVNAQQADMRNQFQALSNRLKQVISQKNDALERAGAVPGVSTQHAHAAIDAGTDSLLNPKPQAAVPAAPGAAAPAATPKAAPAVKSASAAPKYQEGQILQNAEGKRVQLKGNKWIPI